VEFAGAVASVVMAGAAPDRLDVDLAIDMLRMNTAFVPSELAGTP
jgi:hypothetical protein